MSITATRIASIIATGSAGAASATCSLSCLAQPASRAEARPTCEIQLVVVHTLAVLGAAALPRAVRSQLPRRRVVGEDAVEDRHELLPLACALDRDEDLDPAIEVPGHQVRAAEVELL